MKYLVFLIIITMPLSINASIKKSVYFQSSPVGADVILVKGAREILLGKTPLKTSIKFHSELSIVRVIIRKIGSVEKFVSLTAKQKRVDVNLKSVSFLVDSGYHKKKSRLRNMQARVNKILSPKLPDLFAVLGNDFSLNGAMRLISADNKIYLYIPMSVAKVIKNRSKKKESQQMKVLRSIWRSVGLTFVIPIVKKLTLIDGVVFDASVDIKDIKFDVNIYRENQIERKCKGGYKRSPNNFNEFYYDPCKTYFRVVKKTVSEINSSLKSVKGAATYLFLSKNLNRKSNDGYFFSVVSARLVDENKKVLEKIGDEVIPFKM
ncbi:hypothetical protein MNBD_GAMMA09-166 [hydrothermal vent metagenome]|uniref:Uncharacterized protein n=1 Tax=hydrothermal vent metagenome TaxID=652676 RepID=A0A3B0XS39_9ZZZZ